MKRLPLILAAALSAVFAWAAPAFADPLEGATFTQQIATFSSAQVPKQVTIDWGDGSPKQTTGVVTQPDKTGTVTGSHAYAKLGSYQVKVVDTANPDNTGGLTIFVKDAPVTGSGTTFKNSDAPAGVRVASITDANTLGSADQFKTTIDWGDGSSTSGTLVPVAGSPGTYDVTGSHTYPDPSSYIAGVTVTSADYGDANVSVQSAVEGAPDTTSPVVAGKVLDFGRGDDPALSVDEDGTGNLVWAIPASGRTGDSIVYCKLPRGATNCAIKRTFVVDALTGPRIVSDQNGGIHIIVSYNGRQQIGGGTLIISSGDHGASWSYAFYRVNTGLFQGKIIDAALSADGRHLYALFGDYVPGDKSQDFAEFQLDRGTFSPVADPGNVNGTPTYSARSVAVLPDGRAVLAGFDTDAAGGTNAAGPRAALRVMSDGDGNPVDQPWTPIRGGVVDKIAASPNGGASIMGETSCEKGVQISPLRGITVGAPRNLGADRFLACNAWDAQDLTYDAAGGRHAIWLSDGDGCQGNTSHDSDGICIIYRWARPGGDFGPKTTIAKLDVASARGLTVAAGRDGQGWITYQDLDKSTIKVTPTATDSEAPIDADHRIALIVKPSAECSKSGQNTLSVQAIGPSKGKPVITDVDWSSTSGMLPRRKTDSGSPFSEKFSVDKRQFRGLGSTGVIVFTMTATAKVHYKLPGTKATKTASLSQALSYYCGVKFDDVKKSARKK